jgi:hypothetical protein
MSTYPTTPPARTGTPCYTCALLYDIAPLGHAVCDREFASTGLRYTITYPDEGCSCWILDHDRPEIHNRAEWTALHGRGLTGFSDRGDRTFLPPLTAQEARQAAARGDARRLAWEVARLHDVLRRVADALRSMLMHIELTQFREDVALLRELLAKQEPAVKAHMARQAAEKAKWRR